MSDKSTSVQVIERAAQLLDVLANQKAEYATLKVLSAETGLHPSTAFRILSSLSDVGFVQRTDSGKYALGMKLGQLGCRVRSSADIRTEARSVMEWLRDNVGETINLTVKEGDEMVYVERANISRMMKVEQIIGSRAPLHVTAVGKLMLGEGSDEEIDRYAERTGLPRYTANTCIDPALLKSTIRESIARGYALDNEEAELGVGCIGVLVRDASGDAVAGLSISAPISRCKKEWISIIQEAGRRISERLGYRLV